MKRIWARILALLCIGLLGQLSFLAQDNVKKIDEPSAKKKVYEGNKAYQAANYQQAKDLYDQALTYSPTYFKALYNGGNAAYQLENFPDSRQHYEQALKTAHTSKLASAKTYHNIGNTYLKEQQYDAAIDAFKASLRLEPNSYNTKYNLAYAQKMKNQQDQNKNNQDQNKDNQDQNQDQNQDDSKDPQQDNQDQNDRDKQDQQQPQDQPQNQQPQQKPAPKLTKEQAEAILNAMRQNEHDLQKNQKKEKGVPVRMEKDW